ncbi:MAG: methyltransferase domain-containing protein [Proteobacteria bacterium]|nr:methyltransferase domain-containing protein [Pseudomonadota bacterium]
MITVDFEKLGIKPGYRILDMGCGSGRHVSGAYQFKDVVVMGADLCFEDLQKAKDRLIFHDELGAHGGGKWGLSAANILHLPFADHCFDLVICSEVMEHIPDHVSALKEIIRVLKPGRPLVISVPRYFPEKICWLLSDEYFNANQGHVRIYRKKELINLVESHGLTHRGTGFAHSLHAPYWWLKCFVGPTRTDSFPVNLYHRFLTWDMMKKPFVTRKLEYFLNPILAKSLVLYFQKPA